MSELRPCGTVAAARRHRRRGEKLCQACRDATSDDERARREARRAKCHPTNGRLPMSTTDHPNWCNLESCDGTFHTSGTPLIFARAEHVTAEAESEADGPAALRLSVNLPDAYARISLDSDNARVLAERLIELADLIDVDDANVLEDCARECAAAYGHLATAWTQFADEVADAIEHATAEYDPATDYPEPEDDWEMAR